MAKQNNKNTANINKGIVAGDMINMQQSPEIDKNLLRICLDILTRGYLPVSDFLAAQMVLTTPQLQKQIKVFCGLQVPENMIYAELTERGFSVAYGESIILGVPQDFYWLFINK